MIDKLASQGLHMSNESLALVRRPDAADADAYRAFSAALSESARGRAFLAEYARRNRNADTEMLLAALERLEALVRAHMTPAAGIRAELRALLETIRSARPQIDARALPARAAKLAGLLDLLERRINEIARANDMANDKTNDKATDAEPGTPPAATLAAQPLPEAPSDEAARTHLAVVPQADEPELPIPSPSAQPPAIALVKEANETRAAVMPEVSFIDAAPPAVTDVTIAAPPALAVVEQPVAAPIVTATIVVPATPASTDLLAAIMALSEDERIALFT